MFSFIRRWFGKSEKEEDKEEEVELKKPSKDTPPAYSMDFTDADLIRVSARDCRRQNIDAVEHVIVRPAEIEKITELLDELPKEGKKQVRIQPCKEHTLTAAKEGIPFATVTFYAGELKLENGAFIGSGQKALKQQQELFDLIKIDLKQ